jgi:hypothetical protein
LIAAYENSDQRKETRAAWQASDSGKEPGKETRGTYANSDKGKETIMHT